MSVARDLQALLGSAENTAALREIYARVIERILAELAAGVTRPGMARAREVLAKVRELAAQLDPRKDGAVRRWIQSEFAKAYYLGDAAAIEGIEAARGRAPEARGNLVPIPTGAFTAINQLQLRATVAALSDRLHDVQRQILTKAGLFVRRTQLVFAQDAEVRSHIVGGIIRGQTHREVATDIARTILTGKLSPAAAQRMRDAGFAGDLELFRQIGHGQMVTVGQKTMDVRNYSDLVARTMAAEAHRIGTVTRLQQSGINHVRISRHQQAVEDECTLYAGRVFYVGAGVDALGFPSLRDVAGSGPPWHPHCAHVVEAWVAALKPQSTIDAAREDAGLLPAAAFGTSVKEARQLVEVLKKTGRLVAVAPKGAQDVKHEPPKKGAA